MKEIIFCETNVCGEGLKQLLESERSEFAELACFVAADIERDVDQFKDVEVIFSTWNMPILSNTQSRLAFPKLKAIFYVGGKTSYFEDGFDRDKVEIFSAEDENAEPVAEFVLAQIILANKGYFHAERAYGQIGAEVRYRFAKATSQEKIGNYDAVVGIVGFGRVGARLLSHLNRFRYEVLVYDMFAEESLVESLGAKLVSLEELFGASDVITNHLADVPATEGLLCEDYFALMKSDAVFINTGRGRQVNEKDLARAMKARPKALALLDVTAREPLSSLSPLLHLRNVRLTPHIAGSQNREVLRLVRAIVRKYDAYRATK